MFDSPALRSPPTAPGDGKYPDTLVAGIRLITTDRQQYDPTLAAVHLLTALKAAHNADFAFRPAQFDRLAGGPDLRTAVERAEPVSSIARRWEQELAGFEQRRRKFLLYPE